MSGIAEATMISTDGRGRANLAKFSKGETFLARQNSDGTITLEPAEVVTSAQRRMERNPETLKRVEAALANIDSAEEVTISAD